MQDFEKLGVFYLGREYDPAEKKPKDTLLLYDSRDLVTHAVCVGMTGSGKTGLCIGLLEVSKGREAVPVFVSTGSIWSRPSPVSARGCS
jgi:hypothetical protein